MSNNTLTLSHKMNSLFIGSSRFKLILFLQNACTYHQSIFYHSLPKFHGMIHKFYSPINWVVVGIYFEFLNWYKNYFPTIFRYYVCELNLVVQELSNQYQSPLNLDNFTIWATFLIFHFLKYLLSLYFLNIHIYSRLTSRFSTDKSLREITVTF